jgi:hypothetical protein
VNDVHYALLRHPLRSPRPHDVTCRCNSIGRWYVTYDVTFSSASPLSYREIRCNCTSKNKEGVEGIERILTSLGSKFDPENGGSR